MNISSLDITILLIYILACLGLGLYLSKKEGSEGYFVNNRKTKLFFLIFTALSTSVGAGTVLGVASAGFKTGISFGVIFIFAPALLGGLVWRVKNEKSAYWSILLGFLATLIVLPINMNLAFIPGLLIAIIIYIIPLFQVKSTNVKVGP